MLGHGGRIAIIPTRPASVIGRPVTGSTIAPSSAGNGRPMLPGLTGMPGRFVTMIEPVSVCQNVSWKSRPNASRPQWTPSGLSGSPTEHMCLSALRSRRFTISVPSFMSIRIAVGAVYHTVTRCFSIVSYQRSLEKPASRTTWVVPSAHGARMP